MCTEVENKQTQTQVGAGILCGEGRKSFCEGGDFIRASCEHKEARQKLDYWEMEVSCRVTLTVCVGAVTPR